MPYRDLIRWVGFLKLRNERNESAMKDAQNKARAKGRR